MTVRRRARSVTFGSAVFAAFFCALGDPRAQAPAPPPPDMHERPTRLDTRIDQMSSRDETDRSLAAAGGQHTAA